MIRSGECRDCGTEVFSGTRGFMSWRCAECKRQRVNELERARRPYGPPAPPRPLYGPPAPKRKTSPTYSSWQAMRQRCNNPNHEKFPLYGGGGITVCPEWSSYARFLADMGKRPDGMTLDRIDPDGNYQPGNVRWATPEEQEANKRKEPVVCPDCGGTFSRGNGLTRHRQAKHESLIGTR